MGDSAVAVAFPVVFGLAYDHLGNASPFVISSAMVLLSFVLARDIATFVPRTSPG